MYIFIGAHQVKAKDALNKVDRFPNATHNHPNQMCWWLDNSQNIAFVLHFVLRIHFDHVYSLTHSHSQTEKMTARNVQ